MRGALWAYSVRLFSRFQSGGSGRSWCFGSRCLIGLGGLGVAPRLLARRGELRKLRQPVRSQGRGGWCSDGGRCALRGGVRGRLRLRRRLRVRLRVVVGRANRLVLWLLLGAGGRRCGVTLRGGGLHVSSGVIRLVVVVALGRLVRSSLRSRRGGGRRARRRARRRRGRAQSSRLGLLVLLILGLLLRLLLSLLLGR